MLFFAQEADNITKVRMQKLKQMKQIFRKSCTLILRILVRILSLIRLLAFYRQVNQLVGFDYKAKADAIEADPF